MFSFDKMITPVIIKSIFWIGVVLVVVASLIVIIAGVIDGSVGGILLGIFWGILTLVLGPLFVRIWCELMIVAFEIHKNLVEINRKTQEPFVPYR